MSFGLLNFNQCRKLGEKIVERAKKISLPFFDGVPLYDVALFFWRSIVDGSITTRASAIAFSFFIAFFPGIIFLFTLIPYIPIENFQNELFIIIQQLVPESTFVTIEETLTDIIMQPRGGLLSIGFFLALVFSTNGLASMMSAFDATIHSIYRRTWLSQRLAATILLFILLVLLTVAVALLTGGQDLINFLKKEEFLRDSFTVYILTFGKWITIISMFFFAYSFLYYMAPAKKTKWRFISAGGTLATVLSILTLAGFTYYINNFSQYNKLYGSIGTLLIVLLLMYVMSLILLVGFELNASIYQAHSMKEE
ncbi:MAG: YihY/virulence factor BrkB family protein [Prolixibacteraceae bacterium]|jgi:membrane protein|nr:YihY/virulence factor BrkB family protein [Prolixibacteraceae bacterium]MBT6998814.1 YihY/virulence factor BrkB family protein [Prolixibacteraceae bacterium]MBT7396692.1 YihY/virulence factor BrkB family protein [Prolixibacteraceae bacterium]